MKEYSLLVAAASCIISSSFLILSPTQSQGRMSYGCTQWHYGTDFERLPSAYGVPYSLFFTNRSEQPKDTDPPTFIRVLCTDTDWHLLEVGKRTIAETYAVYKYAYEWKNGKWQQLALKGKPLRGNNDWLSRIGEIELMRTPTELAKKNYVAAYACENVENTWKCGCRDMKCKMHGWQLQMFSSNIQ